MPGYLRACGERNLRDFVPPLHSVGKNSGILSGYPVPQITIRYRGVEKVCRNVYLAVSEEEIAGKEIPMLLHPALLQPGDRKEQL